MKRGILVGMARGGRWGFTMVEVLVAVGVLGVFFAAVAIVLQQILTNVAVSRVRSVALALAESKMEEVRNLPYDSVGTVGGIPSGPIEQSANVTINSQVFTAKTSVVYVDDEFDGVAPGDTINNDYKRVRVEVTWGGVFPSRVPVTLVSNISPKGVETAAGGGTLYIQVFDSQGLPVENANVNVDNTVVNPQVHLQTLTNGNGLVVLPGAAACVTCYQISVGKANYSTDRTYSSSEVTNPLLPHATLIEGEVTQISFGIDVLSTVVVNSVGSREAGFPAVANVGFLVRNKKIIGYNSTDDPVYKYEYSTNTGGGTVTLSGLEWGSYELDFSNSLYSLGGSNPVIPFSLSAGSNITVPVVSLPKTSNSLLVVVQDGGGTPLASAAATLTSGSLGYVATGSSGATGAADMGQVYFGGLTSGNYQLGVQLVGFVDASSSVTIVGQKKEVVTLTTSP